MAGPAFLRGDADSARATNEEREPSAFWRSTACDLDERYERCSATTHDEPALLRSAGLIRMTDDRRPRFRVAHPILHLEVIGPDGRRTSQHQVFCREKQRRVLVDVCCACVRCEEITEGPSPAVACTVTAEKAAPSTPDRLGLVTPVGQVLTQGTIAVHENTSLRDALALLHASDQHSMPIVDHERTMVGTLRDTHPPGPPLATVGETMSSRLSLPSVTPVRRALELMAAAHLREVTVVDEQWVPLGVFRDIDGLRWLARAKRG